MTFAQCLNLIINSSQLDVSELTDTSLYTRLLKQMLDYR